MAKKIHQQKSSIHQFSPLGLWIGGAAVISTTILLVIKLLAFIGIYYQQDQGRLNTALWISAGLIIIGPALYALLNPQRVREFITGRQARYGSNAIIMLIAFFGILIVINAIVFQNPHEWDWTEDIQYSLAPETIDTLNALPMSVQAYAFFTQSSPSDTAHQLLQNYEASSNGKFGCTFIDPNADPISAWQYQITQDGTIVLVMGDREPIQITYVSEQEITNALIRLINPGERTVYFTTGHGEHDINGSNDAAYSLVSTALKAKGYNILSLNLAAQQQIPENALAIVIAGPTQPITSDEMQLIEEYIQQGGSLVVMEEPPYLTDYFGSPDPLAEYLSTNWNIVLNNDIVIDTAYSSSPTLAVAASYGDHPITEKLNGVLSFYPGARSISVSTSEVSIKPTILAQTIERAWGETDFTALSERRISFDEATDIFGPITLSVAVENTETGSRLVVYGDSDFATDALFNGYANGEMIINAIDWAAEQENILNLTTKPPIERTLVMPNSTTQLLIGLSFLCIIPGLIVVGGFAAWLIRRSRG